MKKTIYLRAKPTWSGGAIATRYLKGYAVEGPFVKAPNPNGGVVITLELDIDSELFVPPAPKVSVTLDRDDSLNSIKVTGLRVRSDAAKKIVP